MRSLSPRTNLKLSVKRRPKSFDRVARLILDPLVERLRTEGRLMRRTLVYCNDRELQMHASAYHYVLRKLRGAAYLPAADGGELPEAERCPATCLLTMYHGDTYEPLKKQIEADLRNTSGHYRLVFVSSALGRGANFPAIAHIIFLKAPYTLEDLWQVAGRAGRQTELIAFIDVYWRPSDVPRHKASDAMRRLLRMTKHIVYDSDESDHSDASAGLRLNCRRRAIWQYFRFPGDQVERYELPTPAHLCCDLCHIICDCGDHCPTASDDEPDDLSTFNQLNLDVRTALQAYSKQQAPERKGMQLSVCTPLLSSSALDTLCSRPFSAFEITLELGIPEPQAASLSVIIDTVRAEAKEQQQSEQASSDSENDSECEEIDDDSMWGLSYDSRDMGFFQVYM